MRMLYYILDYMLDRRYISSYLQLSRLLILLQTYITDIYLHTLIAAKFFYYILSDLLYHMRLAYCVLTLCLSGIFAVLFECRCNSNSFTYIIRYCERKINNSLSGLLMSFL